MLLKVAHLMRKPIDAAHMLRAFMFEKHVFDFILDDYVAYLHNQGKTMVR